MKVIITMAGEGNRFKKIGISIPKYEIIANGKTLFEWSLLSLKELWNEEFIFVVRKKIYNRNFIEKICNKLKISKVIIKEIDYLTEGQANTVFLCDEYLKSEDEIVIYNIDTYIKGEIAKIKEMKKFDGYIPVFKAEGEKWSFIKLNNNFEVIDIVEKKRISNLASIGFYYFKSWKDYKEIYLKSKEKIKEEFKEIYIAPMYRYLLNENKKIGYKIIDSSNVFVLGTP